MLTKILTTSINYAIIVFMKNNLLENLVEIGLSANEAKIYLSALNLGKATISDLARKSAIKRTSIYQYLANLMQQGLVFKSTQGKKPYYFAEAPEKLIKILDRKKNKIEQILPLLKQMSSTSTYKPKVKFYEGIEGISNIYDEISNTSKIIYSAFSPENYFSLFSEKDNNVFFDNIRKNGGQIKDLVENSELGKNHLKNPCYHDTGTAKLLPKDFDLTVDLIVAGDKVALISLKNLMGVVIENPEIANLHRNFLKFIRKTT